MFQVTSTCKLDFQYYFHKDIMQLLIKRNINRRKIQNIIVKFMWKPTENTMHKNSNYTKVPVAGFTKGLKSSEILVSNLRFFSDFYSDLRPFAQLGFTKDLRLRFFSDLVSNLRLPRG